ncbi:hypothetical protein GVV68_01390 (plasmid) [Bacillus cereus]|uniref:hypothetical protein n=1 Tax=Bacillus cereus group TaxID=86661 RepID=UPI000B44A9C7|nr:MULTISPECIES: hypothetical protein [Bacillus cereus group]OTW84072.1 hypothetical protein BK713_09205 [Bacillus thuringiensis serovar jinghongiensis]OTX19156.1 hypothetical protein BK715_08910 [Bacillus thuringiensis serovar japonensis]WBO70252.1 hypothetical protein GVV68_01390 [Bacillus cereus]
MDSVIIEKSDLLHDVIYEISEGAQDINFPIMKVVDYLIREGYVISQAESTKTAFVLYKENKKTVVTETFIAFESLSQSDRERYKQNFYTYIISRSKIYFQSAVQNSKASKINLIQNQRRACVSNMYYTLHNSFASMVEFYKNEMLINHELFEEENKNDDEAKDETKLEHFVPIALQVFVDNIDDIVSSEKEKFISNPKMNAGRIKSHENPFTWIFPLFADLLEKKQFISMINTMSEALDKVNLENYGVDSTFRRTNFENQLKENLTKITNISREESGLTKKVLCLRLSAFLAYGYMLRQSADYDSLFEIKIPHQDIINWTIITSNFLGVVTEFLGENKNQSIERVQKLDAASSTEILRTADTDLRRSAMTMTGIIIDKELNLIQIIQNLYSHKGYKMINQRGRVSELKNNTDIISMCRILFGTPLECFISFSKQGLFRIDIVLKDDTRGTDFIRGINQFYLEQLIQTDVIEKDLLSVISENASIVRGIPTTPQYNTLNYLDLVVGIHESVRIRILHGLNRHLERYTKTNSTESFSLFSQFTLHTKSLSGSPARIRSLLQRNWVYNKVNKILVIYFSTYNFESSTEIESHALRYAKEKFPQIDFKLELIQLSELEIRQLVEGDFSFFELTIDSLKEKFEKEYTSENVTGIPTRRLDEEYEIDEDDIEESIIDVMREETKEKQDKDKVEVTID